MAAQAEDMPIIDGSKRLIHTETSPSTTGTVDDSYGS